MQRIKYIVSLFFLMSWKHYLIGVGIIFGSLSIPLVARERTSFIHYVNKDKQFLQKTNEYSEGKINSRKLQSYTLNLLDDLQYSIVPSNKARKYYYAAIVAGLLKKGEYSQALSKEARRHHTISILEKKLLGIIGAPARAAIPKADYILLKTLKTLGLMKFILRRKEYKGHNRNMIRDLLNVVIRNMDYY